MERQLVRVASELSVKGYKILILSYDNEPAVSFFEIPENIEWIKCGDGLVPHTGANIFQRLKQIYNLRKILIKYSITHFITFHHGLFPRSLLASLFLPIVKIVSERNSLQNYDFIKLMKFNIGYLSLFFADIITIQLSIYKRDYPYFIQRKIKVIPNLLVNSSSKKEPLINGSIISMMGRLCAQKNFAPLLDQCLSNVENINNIKIRIAGEGEYRKLFEEKYQKLISLGILELMGNVKDIDAFLNASSIFCFSSLWEGYPNSLVEALSSGLPIILSSRLKHLHEFVEHDVNGLIVDDSEYLETIIEILKDRQKLKAMSKKSFSKFKYLQSKSNIKNWQKLIY